MQTTTTTDRQTPARGIVATCCRGNVVTLYHTNVVALYRGKVVTWWRGSTAKCRVRDGPGSRACVGS